MAINKNLTLKL